MKLSTDNIKTLLYFLAAFLIGCGAPIQGGLNAELGDALGSPIRSTLVNFLVPWVLLLFMSLYGNGRPDPLYLFTRANWSETDLNVAQPRTRKDPVGFRGFKPRHVEGKQDIERTHPFFVYSGGPIGWCYVFAMVLATGTLGFKFTFVLLVTGTLIASSLYDHFGVLGIPQRKINKIRGTGLTLVIAGATFTAVGEFGDAESTDYAIAVLALAGGAVLPYQGLINRRSTKYLVNPVRGTFLVFTTGTIVATIAAGLTFAVIDTEPEYNADEWYTYLAGLLGILTVFGGVFFSAKIGVAVYSTLTVLGQLFMSFVLDQTGLLRDEPAPANTLEIVGLVVASVGAIVMQFDGNHSAYTRHKESLRMSANSQKAVLALTAGTETDGEQYWTSSISTGTTRTEGSDDLCDGIVEAVVIVDHS
eukprot:Clim_evm37s25 gene=Clim_evmTU37s25